MALFMELIVATIVADAIKNLVRNPDDPEQRMTQTPPAGNAEQTQAEWNQQMQTVKNRMLAGGGAPGISRPEQIAGKTGLQVMQGMLMGELPYPHIAATLDFGLVAVEEGSATFQGTPQLMHYNPLGSVHGGWFATLLDSALGCAVHTALPAGRGYTTAELSVNIVRAATIKTGPVRAIARVIHSGRQLATAEGRIVGPDGRIYAHGTTTCLVFEIPAK
jgi:uncharacterized protein (TIGR00369 family)